MDVRLAKILVSSIAENESMLRQHVSSALVALTFKPSIPHLVYQYSFFANFPVSILDVTNPEIPPD